MSAAATPREPPDPAPGDPPVDPDEGPMPTEPVDPEQPMGDDPKA